MLEKISELASSNANTVEQLLPGMETRFETLARDFNHIQSRTKHVGKKILKNQREMETFLTCLCGAASPMPFGGGRGHGSRGLDKQQTTYYCAGINQCNYFSQCESHAPGPFTSTVSPSITPSQSSIRPGDVVVDPDDTDTAKIG
uniref:Glycine--tRNA ligase alpha subunit n=1 Tax=Lygus hesperus TaxID=30085 RepID=A0A0A9YQV6_LYGHE